MSVRKVDEGVYPDNGCSVAPKCVTCPLERCRYDTVNRGHEALKLRADRLPFDAIAERLGVSRRTVFRLLKVAR